ncbi:Ribonuclease P protein component, partial [Geodia barretti]
RKQRFAQIHREGTSSANRLLVIRILPNGLEHSRFGFVVSKRIGNAVTRNLIKRRLRESVRQTNTKGGWDAVIIARRGASSVEFSQLKHAVYGLLQRAKLAKSSPSSE